MVAEIDKVDAQPSAEAASRNGRGCFVQEERELSDLPVKPGRATSLAELKEMGNWYPGIDADRARGLIPGRRAEPKL